MNVEAVARVAVRILAIWIFVSAISELPRVASVDTRGQDWDYGIAIAIMVGVVALYCGAGFALWKWAPWVARRIGAESWTPGTTVGGSSAFAIGQVAVGVLGVFMLSSAVPESIWLMVAILASKLMGPSPLAGQPTYDAQMGLYTVRGIANAASVLARLVLGVLLVSKARRVAAVILSDEGGEVASSRPTPIRPPAVKQRHLRCSPAKRAL